MSERQAIQAERCEVLNAHVAHLIDTERIFTDLFQDATSRDERVVAAWLQLTARKQRRWLLGALEAGVESETIANYLALWNEDVVRVVQAGGDPTEVAT